MRYIADLHVHSSHSIATSSEMTPEGIWKWAAIKGISVVGTGDFTHPAWLEELRRKFNPTGDGLYSLNDSFRPKDVPQLCKGDALFVLQAEVSSIYKKYGKTRKVHSIILTPGFKEAEAINKSLSGFGNLKSDGRPILKLPAEDVLKIALDVSEHCMVIPAHAWTPHFSVFGAISGFDSLQECYGDYSRYIYAIETGLSSDPAMNRMWSALDGITLISNSDAHSPKKLGREANIIESDLSYEGLTKAIRTGSGLVGTIEFFPQEGKYFHDGHRNCNVFLSPEETAKLDGICPVCGKRLTVGVLNRVSLLSDRKKPKECNCVYTIPLMEIISQVLNKGINSKSVLEMYFKMISALGCELDILLDSSLDSIAACAGDAISNAIRKTRGGQVNIVPGYDGVYGIVKVG